MTWRATATRTCPSLGRSASSSGRGRSPAWARRQILERFAIHRDGAAFEALVARHGSTVLGVCRRFLRDPNDVEDASRPPSSSWPARRAGSGTGRRLALGSTALPTGSPLGRGPMAVVVAVVNPRRGGDRPGLRPRTRAAGPPVAPRRGDPPPTRQAPPARRPLPDGGPDLRRGRPPAPMDLEHGPRPPGGGAGRGSASG